MELRLIALAAVFSALAGCATTPSPAALADPDISLATMQDVVRTLASDAFEGREPGTAAEEKTLAFIVEQFTAAGLKPGNRGSWFQDVPLVEITAVEQEALTVSGPAAQMSFAPNKDWVGVTYREAQRVSLDQSELVFVGYGIVAPEKGWNDYAGIDMRGKTALILVNDPDYRLEDTVGLFNGRAMTYYGRWTYKFEEAARQGAAGALVVHDTFPAAYGWNVVESSWTGPQSRARTPDRGASQTAVNGWIQKGVAESIIAAAGQNLADLTLAAEQVGFRPVPLGLTVTTALANQIRPYASQNVIGLLPGRIRPGEYVLHTAHWDHLGRCTPNAAGDDICNGAIDNASGVAALVALAKAHVAQGPAARSLVFLSLTAEEQGLLGSEYYASDPVFPLAQTVGGLNVDGMSMAGLARNVTVIGMGKSELDDLLARVLPQVGRRASPDPSPQAGYYYRSDHFPLAKRGVPMFNLKPGEDLVIGGVDAGRAWSVDYRANRYHGPDDEFDPAWDWGGAMADTELLFRLGRDMAQGREWPKWLVGDEFREVRDKACAAPGGC